MQPEAKKTLSAANLALLRCVNIGIDYDALSIIVVGGGLAGATAAFVLGNQGSQRVMLVDPHPVYPPVFKAEKIEPDQAQLLRKFGLLEHLLPHAGRIREVRGGYNGHIFKVRPIEQYGINYSTMVNTIRGHIPGSVERKLGRVEQIVNGPEVQRVKLASGEELTARLVILACGVRSEIQESLGLRKHLIQTEQSMAFGFTIARPDGEPFPFDAVTYYPTSCAARVDYLTLFLLGETMRANLFVFRPATDPWVRQFVKDPVPLLRRSLPKLGKVIGEYRVVSNVESARTDLFRMEGDPQPGVVLIGDAFQNVCPSTGKGLNKVFTDVDVLSSECVPRWFATPGMGSDKIVSFYSQPRKQAEDARAYNDALYRRRASTNRSLRWRIHRLLRLYFPMQFGRPSRVSASEQPTVTNS